MHKKKAGKLQTGITFPKQYWLAVNGKPKTSSAVRTLGENMKLVTGSILDKNTSYSANIQ